ncbi:hypothetical protein Tco_1502361 [Tanacetum coccineum]
MYYPRFTKVIINHFMSKDQSILRRNKVDWHMAKDDPTLTTMRFIPKHEIVLKYDAIIFDTLTNQAMKESDAYKTYHDFATGKVIVSKPKYVWRSTREKTDQAPTASLGKRLKATAKVAKSGKKKLPALTPVVQKSSDEDDDVEVSLSKDDDDNADNEDDDGQDDDNEQTESDNYCDNFAHPKFSTNDESYDDVTHGENINAQGTQVIEDTHVIITVVTPEVQHQSSSVSSDVPVTTMLKCLPHLIVDKYLANKMNEVVKVVVHLQSDRLKDEAQVENEDFINKLDENIKKIIKERRDDEVEVEEPSTGSNRGSKRRRVRKEPESSSAPKEKMLGLERLQGYLRLLLTTHYVLSWFIKIQLQLRLTTCIERLTTKNEVRQSKEIKFEWRTRILMKISIKLYL